MISLTANDVTTTVGMPNQEVYEFIYNNIDISEYCPFLNRSWPGFGAVGAAYPTGYASMPPPRIGRLVWPSGASRFGYLNVVASTRQTNIIRDAVYGNAGSATPAPVSVLMWSGGKIDSESLTCQMYLLPPVPLAALSASSQAGASINGLYLLTLVDTRYYWWYYPIPGAAMGTLNTATWSGFINGIFKAAIPASAIGTLNLSAIPATYLQPDPSLTSLLAEKTPIVLDAIAHNIGCRVVLDFAGNVYFQSQADALTAYQTDFATNPTRTLRAGGARFTTTL